MDDDFILTINDTDELPVTLSDNDDQPAPSKKASKKSKKASSKKLGFASGLVEEEDKRFRSFPKMEQKSGWSYESVISSEAVHTKNKSVRSLKEKVEARRAKRVADGKDEDLPERGGAGGGGGGGGDAESKSEEIPKSERKSSKKDKDRAKMPDPTVKDSTRALGGKPVSVPDGSGYFTVDPFASGKGPEEATTFPDLHLSRPILRAVTTLGFVKPTPIQARTVPLALAGKDVCGSAVTGSGKTAAFLLPAIERLLFRDVRMAATRVLCLAPTRELATQCHVVARSLCQYTKIRCCLVVGGMNLRVQEAELRTRPDIVIATPGRMVDHLRNTSSVHLDDLDILVLDEADRLLEMGFMDEIQEIIKFCPIGRQSLLFSATMTAGVDELIKLSLNKPVRVSTDPLYDMATKLQQEFIRVRSGLEDDRAAIVLSLCTRSFKTQTIVFCAHKKTAHRLLIVMGLAGLKAAELHGNLTQLQRLESMEAFRTGAADFLIATDLASRGLDIQGVKTVINMEMPRDLTTYVHRVGRTARAGRGGVAVTLVGESRRHLMKEAVQRASMNVKARVVPQEVMNYWKEKIASFSRDIIEIYKEERLEKDLRVAEMEANKASNMISHRDEISSRPARTWFQTASEKAALKAAALASIRGEGAAEEKMEGVEAPDDKAAKFGKKKEVSEPKEEKRPRTLNRKKRRRKEALEALAAMDAADGEDSDEVPAKRQAVDIGDAQAKIKAKVGVAAKLTKRTQRQAASALGVSGHKAIQVLKNKEEGGAKKSKKKKATEAPQTGFESEVSSAAVTYDARSAAMCEGGGIGGNNFTGRRGAKAAPAPKGKGVGADGKPRMLRRGGKLGNKQFKSKARFKRR